MLKILTRTRNRVISRDIRPAISFANLIMMLMLIIIITVIMMMIIMMIYMMVMMMMMTTTMAKVTWYNVRGYEEGDP